MLIDSKFQTINNVNLPFSPKKAAHFRYSVHGNVYKTRVLLYIGTVFRVFYITNMEQFIILKCIAECWLALNKFISIHRKHDV
jgi:hypothetical protein